MSPAIASGNPLCASEAPMRISSHKALRIWPRKRLRRLCGYHSMYLKRSRSHSELLGRDETQCSIENLNEVHPSLGEGLPNTLGLPPTHVYTLGRSYLSFAFLRTFKLRESKDYVISFVPLSQCLAHLPWN